MKTVIAIDPGELTGWATGMIENGVLTVLNHGYNPWKEFVLHFADRMSGDTPVYDVVVYETWILRKSSAMELVGSDMQSSQCIGAIKLACWRASKPVKVRRQAPAIKSVIDAMKGGTDYLPKALDNKEHARDGVRHLWYYAVTQENVNPAEAEAA